jgi:pyruvate dehydrogenase E1 component alpha subunit
MNHLDQKYLCYYRKMVTIRQFETLAGELFTASKIPGFIHLSIGQEASAVGVCSCLRADDYLTTTHRGHGQMITKGADMKKMVVTFEPLAQTWHDKMWWGKPNSLKI